MKSEAILKKLKELEGSYLFIMEMQKLSREAKAGKKTALVVLKKMVDECASGEAWRTRSVWCSTTLRVLMATGGATSFKIVISYINRLSDDIPYGCIELISVLLPQYGESVIPHLLKGELFSKSVPAQAIRIQALCAAYLDGMVDQKYEKKLEQVINNFKGDRYMTGNLVEEVRSRLSGGDELLFMDELEELLKDVIVEK